jgi:hypothetical protein
MRVRDFDDILADVTDGDVDPEGWRAAGGDRRSGVGEDLYIGHPQRGLYHLKTYAKNPFDVRGVGARVARSLDDELGAVLPDSGSGRFAVQSAPEDEDAAEERANRLEQVLKAHSDAPTTGEDLFEDVMDAVESPAFGPMEYDDYGRPEAVEDLSTTFEEAEEVLDTELDELVRDAGTDRGFQ